MKNYTTIHKREFSDHLQLRYDLFIASRLANVITFSIIAVICLIEYLRVVGG